MYNQLILYFMAVLPHVGYIKTLCWFLKTTSELFQTFFLECLKCLKLVMFEMQPIQNAGLQMDYQMIFQYLP